MRGSDVPNNPFFFAYVIVRNNSMHTLFIDQSRLTDALRKHLAGFYFKDYTAIEDDITAASGSSVVWVSPMSSYAIYNAVSNKVPPFVKI